MRKTRNIFLIVTLFLAAAFMSPERASAEIIDKVLVVVNDEIITQGEIDRILLPIYHRYSADYADQELVERLQVARRNVLETLINDKLLLAEARKREIKVKPKEVQAKIDEVKKRFATDEEFKTALQSENMLLSDFERTFRDRLMIDKVIDEEVRRRVYISPNEALSYYEKHRDKFTGTKRIKARSILIRVSETMPPEEALPRAKEILGRLEEGGNFALLAGEYSDGPYASKGGDMGWVVEGDLLQGANEVLFNLEENEISGILETPLGYHIFKADEVITPEPLEFREVKKQVEHVLYGMKVEEELGRWIKRLKENAYIAFR